MPFSAQRDPRLVDAAGLPNRTIHYLAVIGRLAPGASVAAARADLNDLARRRAAEFPDTNAGWAVTARPLHEQTVGQLRPALMTLLIGVGVVLLITCINVANVLLARATGRQRDLSIRSALGASRYRLIRQSLVESTLLGLAGGLAGMAVMWAVTQAILAMAPSHLPRLGEVTARGPVLLFGAIISLATGLVVGVLPAMSASRSRAEDALRETHRTTASAARQRWRAALIVAEVAMAMTLAVGAGLLARSFQQVLTVDPGFRPDNVLTFQIAMPARHVDLASRVGFYDQLDARLRALPGVAAVGGTTRVPLGSTSVTTMVEVDGRNVPAGQRPEVELRRAVFDYFGAMGIPLVRGRVFEPTDVYGAPNVAVVNTAFVDRVFPGEDPIGRRIRIGSAANQPWITIVGVVGSIRHLSLEETPRPEFYISHRQGPPVSPFLTVRTTGNPAGLAPSVREVLRALGADPPTELQTMEQIRQASVAERRFVLVLVGVFGALALVLAGIGVYGVITLLSAERAGEVGIRLALGATPTNVLGLVVRHAVTLAAAGVAAGGALALAATSALTSQLYGVHRADPVTYAGVALMLILIAAAAALVPARRSMRIDPAVTLRQ
jgi:predicted permease